MNTATKRSLRTRIMDFESFEYEDEDTGDAIDMECDGVSFSGHVEYQGDMWDFDELSAVDVLDLIDEYF